MISSLYSSHPIGTFISSFWSLLTWDASNLAILNSSLANLELVYPLWSVSVDVFLTQFYAEYSHALNCVETSDFVVFYNCFFHTVKLYRVKGEEKPHFNILLPIP